MFRGPVRDQDPTMIYPFISFSKNAMQTLTVACARSWLGIKKSFPEAALRRLQIYYACASPQGSTFKTKTAATQYLNYAPECKTHSLAHIYNSSNLWHILGIVKVSECTVRASRRCSLLLSGPQGSSLSIETSDKNYMLHTLRMRCPVSARW